ncbi:hypothetical protein [Burkholderia pseudomallei]|nr:hypothetical protein [Burkholderia pseudomallei]
MTKDIGAPPLSRSLNTISTRRRASGEPAAIQRPAIADARPLHDQDMRATLSATRAMPPSRFQPAKQKINIFLINVLTNKTQFSHFRPIKQLE